MIKDNLSSNQLPVPLNGESPLRQSNVFTVVLEFFIKQIRIYISRN